MPHALFRKQHLDVRELDLSTIVYSSNDPEHLPDPKLNYTPVPDDEALELLTEAFNRHPDRSAMMAELSKNFPSKNPMIASTDTQCSTRLQPRQVHRRVTSRNDLFRCSSQGRQISRQIHLRPWQQFEKRFRHRQTVSLVQGVYSPLLLDHCGEKCGLEQAQILLLQVLSTSFSSVSLGMFLSSREMFEGRF